MKKYTGIVKWYNHIKGYGFVAYSSSEGSDKSTPEKDVFIHKSALERAGIKPLKPGDKISFEIKDFKGKISAENIALL